MVKQVSQSQNRWRCSNFPNIKVRVYSLLLLLLLYCSFQQTLNLTRNKTCAITCAHEARLCHLSLAAGRGTNCLLLVRLFCFPVFYRQRQRRARGRGERRRAPHRQQDLQEQDLVWGGRGAEDGQRRRQYPLGEREEDRCKPNPCLGKPYPCSVALQWVSAKKIDANLTCALASLTRVALQWAKAKKMQAYVKHVSPACALANLIPVAFCSCSF